MSSLDVLKGLMLGRQVVDFAVQEGENEYCDDTAYLTFDDGLVIKVYGDNLDGYDTGIKLRFDILQV